MIGNKQVDILKSECYDLYKFKDNPVGYEKAAIKLEQRVMELELNRIVDPILLSFLMLYQIKSLLSDPAVFKKGVDRIFEVKKISFFFQLPELVGFPDDYQLGHGKLRNFDSLPAAVRDFAVGLTEGRVGEIGTDQERVQTVFLQEIVIPRNPKTGCWFEISMHGSDVNGFTVIDRAVQAAEESLDILRILRPHIRILLPQYLISKVAGQKKASFKPFKIELFRYHFDQEEQRLIDRLNGLLVSPSTELEKRVLNALHFYRIGRNFSPEYQELFYYVAAIENLVIGKDDRDVLRWKFSEKAAFLLEDDTIGRMEMVARLRDLYDARSSIAHGSVSPGETKNAQLARRYLVRIIMRILELIDKRGLQSVSPLAAKKSSLDEYIDRIKYSGKPQGSLSGATSTVKTESV